LFIIAVGGVGRVNIVGTAVGVYGGVGCWLFVVMLLLVVLIGGGIGYVVVVGVVVVGGADGVDNVVIVHGMVDVGVTVFDVGGVLGVDDGDVLLVLLYVGDVNVVSGMISMMGVPVLYCDVVARIVTVGVLSVGSTMIMLILVSFFLLYHCLVVLR